MSLCAKLVVGPSNSLLDLRGPRDKRVKLGELSPRATPNSLHTWCAVVSLWPVAGAKLDLAAPSTAYGYIGENVDVWSARPTDGGAGRYRPASGAGDEIEGPAEED